MTLQACPECGGQISDQAQACPHCGHPVKQATAETAPPTPPKTAKQGDGKPKGKKGCFRGCLFVTLIATITVIAAVILSALSMKDLKYAKVATNIRGGRGTEFPVIGKLKAGEAVKADSLLDGWYRVKMNDSKVGYVSAELLNKERPARSTMKRTAVAARKSEDNHKVEAIDPVRLMKGWQALGLNASIPWRPSNLSGWICQCRKFVGERAAGTVTPNEVNGEILGASRTRVTYAAVEAEIYNPRFLTQTVELAVRAISVMEPNCPDELLKAFREEREASLGKWRTTRVVRPNGYDLKLQWGEEP
jgi:SH3-like domain-containing protein